MLSWPAFSALLLPCNLTQRLGNATLGVACYDNGNGLTRLLQNDDRFKEMFGGVTTDTR